MFTNVKIGYKYRFYFFLVMIVFIVIIISSRYNYVFLHENNSNKLIYHVQSTYINSWNILILHSNKRFTKKVPPKLLPSSYLLSFYVFSNPFFTWTRKKILFYLSYISTNINFASHVSWFVHFKYDFFKKLSKWKIKIRST